MFKNLFESCINCYFKFHFTTILISLSTSKSWFPCHLQGTLVHLHCEICRLKWNRISRTLSMQKFSAVLDRVGTMKIEKIIWRRNKNESSIKKEEEWLTKHNQTDSQIHLSTTNSLLKSTKSTYAYILNGSDKHHDS